jgi:hypothetical protein
MGLEIETDDGSTGTGSSALVEMSTLGKGTTTIQNGGFYPSESISRPAVAEDDLLPLSPEAPSPSTPPTASPTTPYEIMKDSEHQNAESNNVQAYVLTFMPQSQSHMIRTAMTMLLGLMVAGMLYTFVLVPQYALLLGLLWIVLISLFGGLAWFIQNAVLQNRSTVLHPYIHAAAAAVIFEYKLFAEDWREEVLMLTNEAANPDKTVDASARAAGPYMLQQPKRKGKSRLFRLAVRPFLPMMSRRRQRRKDREESNPAASSYVPPDVEHV